MKRILISFLFTISLTSIFANTIEGLVKDAATGETLTGANIYLKSNKQLGTISGLDGSFKIYSNLKGKHTLVCSYISYETLEKEIEFTSNSTESIELNLISYENELNGITVIADGKNSDASIRSLERQSTSVVNIVGARSIEISPDLNVANVLGRISGVTLERNSSGEAEYAVLRGMDKRYNITLVNGVKISSPNNKQRFVPLNIFPSELLDRLEVTKTRGAETEGDATGGAINMVMKDAPTKLTIKANLAGGYNSMFMERDFSALSLDANMPVAPYELYGKDYIATMTDLGGTINTYENKQAKPNLVAGVSAGTRLVNNKFGFIVAANYQNTNKGTNTIFFGDDMRQTESTLYITDMKERTYSENQQNFGIHAKLDYIFNKRNKVEWYNFFVEGNNSLVRYSQNTNFKLSYDPENGTVDHGYQYKFQHTNQTIFASSLLGTHQINDKFSANWSAVFSTANLNRPDLTYINIDNLIQDYVDHIEIDGDGSERRWEHNSDRDLSGLGHLNYKPTLSVGKLVLQGGVLGRYKSRENFYVRYTIKPIDTNQAFETLDQINWYIYNPKGSVSPLNYSASEIIAAGYLQSRFETGKQEVILGLRSEFTNQGYHMYFPNAGEPADNSQIYSDLLPNFQYKFSPNHKNNFRASYFRSINRPGYFEIVPYQIQEEEYTEYGNKNLKRTHIDNIDLRWEYFPKPLDQLLIGAFFKNIESPIEFAYFSVNQRQSGYGLRNLGNAKNVGLEVDYIKFVRALGIKANYTFTRSTITTSKVYYGKDALGNSRTLTQDQTRPLTGQAAHVGNISLLFKDIKKGWNAQLASSYTGEKIVIASRFLDSDYWEKPQIQLDASIEKDFNHNLSIFAKANNLLNTTSRVFLKSKNPTNNYLPFQSASDGETLIKESYYKQSFLIGIRYKL